MRCSASFVVWLLLCLAPTAAWAAGPDSPPGYGLLLFKMVAVLGGVCLLAWVSLRWGLRRFVQPGASASAPMCVVARLPVEPRRSILVVRVGERHLVLGSSEAGFETLGELSPEEASVFDFAKPKGTPTSSFSSILARLSRADVSRETVTEETT